MKALYVSAAFLGLLALGCKKDEKAKETAGPGGPASLRISLTHEGVSLDSGRVRIRYNATTPPDNPLNWDDSADVTQFPSSPPQALFSRLRRGTYFIEGKGYLPLTTFQNPRIVTGSFTYYLTDTGAVNITLPLDKILEPENNNPTPGGSAAR